MRNNQRLSSKISAVSRKLAEGLISPLTKIVERLGDSFLLGILGLMIVLAIVALARADLSVVIVLTSAVVVLFLGYLWYRVAMSMAGTERVVQELASQIVTAIQKGGYIRGPVRQRDFGASLVKFVLDSRVSRGDRKAIAIMAEKFKQAFGVPESYLSE